jgi:RsiW-degrading membrane proteinase PrsW (M82 family)
MQSPYKKFALVISINAIAMFFITYVMIDSMDHFYFNINRVYMALLMVAPMVVLMLFIMRSMYKNTQLNLALYAGFIGLFILLFFFIRTQTPVGNEEFLRSMIPHHSSAILMCEQANLTDPEIVSLCEEIVQTQLEEIAQMEEILGR